MIMIRKTVIAFLIMTFIPLFAAGQIPQKTSIHKTPLRTSQTKKSQQKAPELKVVLSGRIVSKEEKPVQGVDYAPPIKSGGLVMTSAGNCGWMSLSGNTVSRIYVAVSELKADDGQIITEWAGKDLRIACESLKEHSEAFTSENEVHISGVIRKGKKLEGKEIVVISVTETP